jgi:hypothetical protein
VLINRVLYYYIGAVLQVDRHLNPIFLIELNLYMNNCLIYNAAADFQLGGVLRVEP